MRRRVFGILGIVLIIAIGACSVDLATTKNRHFNERAGVLTDYRAVKKNTDLGISESVTLHSSTGLTVELRTLRPAVAHKRRLPIIITVGGYRTGKNAVDLVADVDGVAYVAIDYPYDGSRDLNGISHIAAAMPRIRRAFLDTPPALSLTLTWLLEQEWADPDRVELVGVSLGVPFAAAAGAVDSRFSRVWLIHGGADNHSWVEHAGREAIANPFLRSAFARTLLFWVYGNSFDTSARMREIAPRPVIVVAAADDDFVPSDAQQPFIDAAERNELELIWTEGLHVNRKRPDVVAQLFSIVLERIRNEDIAGVTAPES